MELAIGLVIGLAVGVVIGVLIARAFRGGEAVRLSTQLDDRTARLADAEKRLSDQETALREAREARAALEARFAELKDARDALENSFKALAGEVLKQNSDLFLGQARREMQNLLNQAEGSFEKRREAIEKVVRPLSESLVRYEQQLKAVEKDRTDAYGGLRNLMDVLARNHEALKKETGNLTMALRNPQVQGRWGELTLRRTAELAGMSQYCDFAEQVHFAGEGGAGKPDMIVRLPSERVIVVDSKAPLQAYVDAVNAPSGEERDAKLKAHASKVRDHMRLLSRKSYQSQFDRTPEFTVMFLPGENFFSAALRADPALLEDAMKQGIVLATPTTLIALLHAVAQGWREAQVAANAVKISEMGRELYDRMAIFIEHFDKVGNHLAQAARTYNQAVGSLEARLRPSVLRLKELGATTAADIAEAGRVSESIRLPAPEEPDAS